MFSLGGLEWVIIIVVAFLIFGPDKLPQFARTIGKYIRQFRAVQEQMSKTVQDEIYEPMKDDIDAIAKPLGDIKNPFDDVKDPFRDIKNPLAPPALEAPKNTGAASAAAATDAPTTPTESFAERRARLEKEYADKKAAQKVNDLEDKDGSSKK